MSTETLTSTDIVEKIRRTRSDEATLYHIKNLFRLMREGDKYSFWVANKFCNQVLILKKKDGTLPKKHALNMILQAVVSQQPR